MENTHVTVSLPRQILREEGLSEIDAAKKMRKLFVLDLLRHRRISSGKAARLLGIRKRDIVRIMAAESLPYFDYSVPELEEEFRIVDEWDREKNAGV